MLLDNIYKELRLQCNMAISALEEAGKNIVDYNIKSNTLNSYSFLEPKNTTLPDRQKAVEFNQDKIRLMLREIDRIVSSFLRNMHSFILCHANISKIKEWDGNRNRQYSFTGDVEYIKNKIADFFINLNTFGNPP